MRASPGLGRPPELYFKAFLLREAGRFGAIANSFSSLYLWRHDEAYRDWLASGGYRIITDRFGRGAIDTRVALDARQRRRTRSPFLSAKISTCPLDADLTAAFAREIEHNREIAAQPDTVAAAVGADTQNWKIHPHPGFQSNSSRRNENGPRTRSFIWRALSSIRFEGQTIA